jgi:hypothetical protein
MAASRSVAIEELHLAKEFVQKLGLEEAKEVLAGRPGWWIELTTFLLPILLVANAGQALARSRGLLVRIA